MENLIEKHFAALASDLDAILADQGYDQLLVYSGSLRCHFEDDLTYPFKVNPYFKMLVPLTKSRECWVVWRGGRKPKLLLVQPENLFRAPPATPGGVWSELFEVHVEESVDNVSRHFDEKGKRCFLGESDDLPDELDLGVRNPPKLISAINWRRSYKSRYEQECIRHANEISYKGHHAAESAFRSGASELEISLEFQRACEQDEYRLAYRPVVGTDSNASILHHFGRDTNRVLAGQPRSVLIDAGAEYMGYASDVTRTHSAQDDEFGQLIEALDQGQQAIARGIQIGERYLDVNTRSKIMCAELLQEFRLVNTAPETTVKTGLIDYFYPHGIGHFLGLRVHDVAAYYAGPSGEEVPFDPKHQYFRLMRTVEENHVFTVEPGIYFMPALMEKLEASELRHSVNWKKVRELQPFGGIRIEDNIVMTGEGPINLTREAFSQVCSEN